MAGHSGPWGWHRLDERWAARLVALADVRAGELVLDVGAGAGVVTAALRPAGARVVAFELHPGRAAQLRERFAGDAVVVVRADVADLRLPRRPFKVVANPSFGVTGALLRRLTSGRSRLQRASIVVPHWAAARWAAAREPWDHGFECRLGSRVPSGAFKPEPPADPRVLLVRRRPR